MMIPTDKKSDDSFLNELTDLKRIVYLYLKKIWLIILITVIGAGIGAGLYLLYTGIVNGETKYRMETEYYITFNEADYPNGMDFYNAYTWTQFVVDDHITDYALNSLPENVTKDKLKECVSSYMPGDYRLLTVVVSDTDPEVVKAINESYKEAMPHFATCIPELSDIQLWSCDDIYELKENTKSVNAAVIGAIIAFVVAVFGFAFYQALDGKIYLESDIAGVARFLGYDAEGYKEELNSNLEYITGDKKYIKLEAVEPQNAKEYRENDMVVLELDMGKTKLTKLKHDIEYLSTQDISVAGIIIKNCDMKLLKFYY